MSIVRLAQREEAKALRPVKAILSLVVLAALASPARAAQQVEEQVVRPDSTAAAPVNDRDADMPEGYQENPFAKKKGKRAKPAPMPAAPIVAQNDEPMSQPKDVEDYAADASRAAYETQLREMRAKEDAERREAKTREQVEHRKVEATDNVERHKRDSAEFRMKREKAEQNIEMLQVEVKEFNQRERLATEDYGKAEQLAHDVMKAHAEYEDMSRQAGRNVERAEGNLAALQKQIYKTNIEVQKMRSDIADNESRIAVIENDRLLAESNEIQARDELFALRAKNKDLALRRQQAMGEVADAQKHLVQTKNEYFAARQQNEKADKDLYDYNRKAEREIAEAQIEVKKLEQDMQKIAASKLRDDAEREHVAEQIERAKQDVADAKDRHARSQSEANESAALVIESRLALKEQKSELSREYANFENGVQKNETRNTKIRALASMAESSDMLEGQRASIAIKGCALRAEPSAQGAVISRMQKGTRALTWPAGAGWSKVMNDSGSPRFVDSDCLKDAGE